MPKLTQDLAATFTADKPDQIVWDNALTGFGLRARPSGKVWVAQFRILGRTRRVTIGSASVIGADQARRKAKEILSKAALGQDVAAEKEEAKARAANTLGTVVERFLAFKQTELAPSTHRAVQTFMRQHWRPLHDKPLASISRRDVAAILSEMRAERGPVAAQRARSWLSVFYVWAMGEGIAESNPTIGTTRTKETARERVLSDSEIVDIWRATDDGSDYSRIIRVLLLTGQRRSEVGGLRWSEIDCEKATITLPPSRTKNGRAHQIPMSSMVADVVASVPRLDRDNLFGAAGFTAYHTGWLRFGATIAAARAKDGREPMPPFVVHDLRRSVATGMANLGVQPHVIEAALNHVSGHKAGVAGVYNKSTYANEVRRALALWSDHIAALVEGGERKLLAFERR